MAFLAGMDGCIGMVLGTDWLLIWSGGISCNSSAAYSLSLERFLEENNKKAPCYLLISSFFFDRLVGMMGTHFGGLGRLGLIEAPMVRIRTEKNFVLEAVPIMLTLPHSYT
jgi:hypothetical protein